MSKNNEQLVMGLDVGSSKITCAVGEVSTTGRITILEAKEVPSLGLRKGTVADADLALASLREAVKPMQPAKGSEIAFVQVGFSPQVIDTYLQKAVIPISGSRHRVNGEDLCQALRLIKTQSVFENRKILHIVPTEFFVDNQLVKEPHGKVGNNLTVEALVVTTEAKVVDNLVDLMQRAGIKVKDVMLSCFVSAEAVLNVTDKEFGAIYVDMGGQTTGIVVYTGGVLKKIVILPIGSDYITSDLAIGLRTPLACAERIKLEYGVQPNISTGGVFTVDNLKGEEKRQISCRMAVDIIEARVNEIFTLVREAIEQINYSGLLPSGIILGGGGALLPGLVTLAEKQIGLPVRIRMPQVHLKPGVNLDSPANLGAIGLIKYLACTDRDKPSRRTQNLSPSVVCAGLMGKFKTWIYERF